MRPSLSFAFCLFGALLISGSLSAQDLRFGLQANLAYPTSDLGDKPLLDNSIGYGLGAHFQIAFDGGHAIVPRLDYTYFEKGSPNRKVQMMQLGADYNYFISGKVNQGFYFGGGLGFGMAKFEVDLPGMSDNDTPNTAYGDAALGFMFDRNLGAELRYVYAKYKPRLFGVESEINSPTINATFIYRF